MLRTATLGESFRSFFDAVDEFFSDLAEVELGSLLDRAACVRHLPHAARSRLVQHPARGLPDRVVPLPRHLGRLLRRLRLQRRDPGARRRRGAPVPHQDLGAASRATRRWARRSSSRPASTWRWASSMLTFAFTQGVFPKPPDFADLNAFDLSFFASHPRVHPVPAHRRWGSRSMVAFALLSARVKAFWARVRQGLTILLRPPPLLPRGVRGAAGGLGVPLHRVLVPARGVQRRRLGEERAAGAGRERGGGRGAVHARRARGSRRRCWPRCSPAPRRAPPWPPTRSGQQIAIGGVHLRASASRRCCSSSACAASRRSSGAGRRSGGGEGGAVGAVGLGAEAGTCREGVSG